MLIVVTKYDGFKKAIRTSNIEEIDSAPNWKGSYFKFYDNNTTLKVKETIDELMKLIKENEFTLET